MPHQILQKLYAERALLRRLSGRFAAHSVAVRIRHAEQVHGAQMVWVRRCPTCALLHVATLARCDNQGRYLFELMLEHSPDRVRIVED